MAGQLALGLALVVLGSVLDVPPVILLGIVVGLVEVARQVWVRYGLTGVGYSRRLPRQRATVGEPVAIDISIWNRKLLPLSWIRAEDRITARLVGPATGGPGITFIERPGPDTTAGQSLVNVWSLAPFERVTRHFHAVASRRGVYRLGPAALETGDLFARPAASADTAGSDHWLVHPRSVTVRVAEREDPWGGERRTRHGRIEDPTRYAGIRQYQPGDPVRAIHWRATARLGVPVSRVFEPGRHREVVVVLDLQTIEGPHWATSFDDDAVESLCVAAASLLRRLRSEGADVGLATTGYSAARERFAYVAPRGSDAHVGRCLDVLARLGSLPAVRLEESLGPLMRTLRPGCSVLILTTRDPRRLVPALKRVTIAGHAVQVIRLVKPGGDPMRPTRGSVLEIRTGQLDGPWQSATALLVR